MAGHTSKVRSHISDDGINILVGMASTYSWAWYQHPCGHLAPDQAMATLERVFNQMIDDIIREVELSEPAVAPPHIGFTSWKFSTP